jgi:integrase
MTVRKLESLKDGTFSDGGNLWITVVAKNRTWSFRYKSPVTGKRREMGLGAYRDVPLAAARQLAEAARKLLRDGVDPLEHRQAIEAASVRERTGTFESVASQYIVEQSAGWRDPRLAGIWTSSLKRLAFPTIGAKSVATISTDDMLAVLRPIWTTTNETADRVRGRIERILDYAITHGWRKETNPARWRGHLINILPDPSSVAQVKHRPAVPWQEIGPVMKALARSEGMGALAVRFACLTAARSAEVRAAPWLEVDLKAQIWTIPAERMKQQKEHRVPLSKAALEVRAAARALGSEKNAFIFPGGRTGRPLSDVALSKALHLAAKTKNVTVHGLRSTFRDWVAEDTQVPRELAEMALAHTVGDKVEAAYRRSDLLERRRPLMENWGKWCFGGK